MYMRNTIVYTSLNNGLMFMDDKQYDGWMVYDH